MEKYLLKPNMCKDERVGGSQVLIIIITQYGYLYDISRGITHGMPIMTFRIILLIVVGQSVS